MGKHSIHQTITVALALLSCALFYLGWAAPADSQEKPLEAAKEIVEHVLGNEEKSPPGDLGSWSRSVLERALGRARKNAPETSTPLPTEDQAGRLAGRLSEPPRGPEIIVFMSLSVPGASLRQWSREAARIGAPLVLRGVARGGLKATVKHIGAHLAEGAGAAIDPRLFRLFEVKAVPAVAVVPGGVPPCESRGCSADPAPAHDLVRGNIGLEAALRIVAGEGGPGRGTARRHLGKLKGEHP